MSEAGNRPWLSLYPTGLSGDLPASCDSLLSLWRARMRKRPDDRAVIYFDRVFTTRELDELSDALAVMLRERGVGRGDRVGIHLQNVPFYPLLLLALWKLGASPLLLNPMYFGRELRHIAGDAQPVGIIATDADVDRIRSDLSDLPVRWIFSVDERNFQSLDDARVFRTDQVHRKSTDGDLLDLLHRYRGRKPEAVELGRNDLAFLTYTSGTSGPSKGALNSHGNVLAVLVSLARFVSISESDVIYALAPIFHITGAVALATMALMEGGTLVLSGRFNAEVALEAMRDHKVTFTTGAITAYIAMMNHPGATRESFASIRTLYSGGAPVAPSIVEEFEKRFGHYIHNAYGMTETTNGVIAVPPGKRAPVDGASGTLSVGVPLPGLQVEIRDGAGKALACGNEGELVMSGPQIVSGYWRNHDATAAAVPDGWLHSGDAAVMDPQGWVYLVDRMKDQINVSGYKVWPREVEDCLYEHPAVLEVGVVGMPDRYQGESVAAFVSLRPGAKPTESELVAFVRERLAAYKVPRRVLFMDALPKTQTGKIRRTELRQKVEQR